jgi:hypothetical protein
MRSLALAALGSLLLLPSPTRSADAEPVPPGSPADQELWRAAGEVSQRVQLQRIAANKIQWDFRAARPDERLLAAAKAAPPEQARRLAALHERLVAAWIKNYQLLVDRWPVDPTRGCLYARLFLDSSMRAGDGPTTGQQLAQARDEARLCVDTARAALARFEATTRELEAALAETDRALPGATVPAAPAAAERQAPPPPPAVDPGPAPVAAPAKG